MKIDIEDYLDEVETDTLITELEKRGFTVEKQELPISFEHGYELRDHLLDIASLGLHASEGQLFDALSKLMKM